MWPKAYRDYPQDLNLIKQKVEPGKGIIGCEMHDLNGWGEAWHKPVPPKPGFFAILLGYFSKKR